jgi:hypothetical protein|tara:strand:- start:503 stop:619 length:117 start_codon:yes stop_codon:yes gene_type:complete
MFAAMDTQDMEELRRRKGVEQVHWKVRAADLNLNPFSN